MTTDIKIRTNGSYVAEVRNDAGDLLGSNGPSSHTGGAVESNWINVGHGGFIVIERSATEDEIHAANNGDTGNTGEHDDLEVQDNDDENDDE